MFSTEPKLTSMSLEIDVLRALLRLARRRTPPTLEQLFVRVGGDEPAVRLALRSLARRGLVQRTPAGLRLSLPGLAVAVACAQRPRTVAAPVVSRTTNLVRRRRAA
jgi:DNA-binding IclR family transcriptional regulator